MVAKDKTGKYDNGKWQDLHRIYLVGDTKTTDLLKNACTTQPTVFAVAGGPSPALYNRGWIPHELTIQNELRIRVINAHISGRRGHQHSRIDLWQLQPPVEHIEVDILQRFLHFALYLDDISVNNRVFIGLLFNMLHHAEDQSSCVE